jgi:hypothetical protein
MAKFIEVHTNYSDEGPLRVLVNTAQIVKVSAVNNKTRLMLTSFAGDSDDISTDSLCIMESFDEVKKLIQE